MNRAFVIGILASLLAPTLAARGTTLEKPTPSAATPAKKQWVWLSSQGLWGFGYRLEKGPHRGLWRIEPGMKYAPAPAGDPYGFAAILNGYRAAAGLPELTYDPELTSWAAENNVVQNRRGIGHHVSANCFQNCAWNYGDAASVAEGWMRSPGHRQNMLNPSATRFGIAYGPGPYWTMNAQ